jgi:hypothetical protein
MIVLSGYTKTENAITARYFFALDRTVFRISTELGTIMATQAIESGATATSLPIWQERNFQWL